MWSRRDKTAGKAAGDSVLLLGVEGMHCASCGLTIDDWCRRYPALRERARSCEPV
jgi:hypothetical protein